MSTRTLAGPAVAALARLVIGGVLMMALFAQSAPADVPGNLFGSPDRGFSPANPALGSTPADGGGRTGESTNTGPQPTSQPPANAPAQPQRPGSAPPAPAGNTPLPRTPFRCTVLRHHRGTLCRTFVGGKLTRSCTTRGHTRRCVQYSARGQKIRVCTKRGSRREVCHRIAAKSAAKGSPRRSAKRTGPASRAQAAALINNGSYNPGFATIVRLYCNNGCTQNAHNGYCSGTLVRPGLVLTAAHCIYDNDPSDGDVGQVLDNTNVIVTPGVDQRSIANFGKWGVTAQYVPQGWKNGDQSLDWGIVVLAPDSSNRYAGDYAGTEAATWGATIRQGDGIWNLGYAGDGPFNTLRYAFGDAQSFCWSSTLLGTVADPNGVNHWTLVCDCDMNRGSSGGPVFARVNSAWYIVGANNAATFRGDGFGATNTSVWMGRPLRPVLVQRPGRRPALRALARQRSRSLTSPDEKASATRRWRFSCWGRSSIPNVLNNARRCVLTAATVRKSSAAICGLVAGVA
jgi:V8-like Glu-specific endopeptidase